MLNHSDLKIAKFGGKCVATEQRMISCATIIQNCPALRVVVVSATGETTEDLLSLAQAAANCEDALIAEILCRLEERHKGASTNLFNEAKNLVKGISLLREVTPSVSDQLLSIGERLSSQMMTRILKEEGLNVQEFDIRQVMRTSSRHGEAQPYLEELKRLCEEELVPILAEGYIVVTQGFIGRSFQGKTTTLGRGGSDYSAALLAEALEFSELQIWTDVPGIASADPRLVPQAQTIKDLAFVEAAEMATFGAKVLHPASLWPAIRSNIPIFVGSSIEPERGGTMITKRSTEKPGVRVISLREQQVLLTLQSLSMLHRPGYLAKVFTLLESYGLSVDLITTSEVSISLTLDQGDQLTDELIHDLEKFAHVEVETKLALIAVIGNHINSTAGMLQKLCNAIQGNIRLVCQGASDHNLCLLVPKENAHQAVRDLHKHLIEKEALVCSVQS